MADEFNDSNRRSLLGADQYITNQNPTGSESTFTASWGSSSSSFLNTSFESELDSSETDNDDGDGDDDFVAELTRQMADYMLQDDDIVNNDNNTSPKGFISQKPISQVTNHNQHRLAQNSELGRKGKMTESTQQMKSSSFKGGRVRPVGYGSLAPSVGSGMRAIFLNRSGSKKGSNGTGVFLPRSATDTTAQSRKKPGCSTALVPTRVLQALEQHFNKMESLSPTSDLLQPTQQGQRGSTQQKLLVQSSSTTDHLERRLPREWTY